MVGVYFIGVECDVGGDYVFGCVFCILIGLVWVGGDVVGIVDDCG